VVVKDFFAISRSRLAPRKVFMVDKVGVRRRGYSRATIAALHHAFHLLPVRQS